MLYAKCTLMALSIRELRTCTPIGLLRRFRSSWRLTKAGWCNSYRLACRSPEDHPDRNSYLFTGIREKKVNSSDGPSHAVIPGTFSSFIPTGLRRQRTRRTSAT